MSARIRPLPVEAAPQRTESDAKLTTSTQPDKVPVFGEVLKLRINGKSLPEPPPNKGPEQPSKQTQPTGKQDPSPRPSPQAISNLLITKTSAGERMSLVTEHPSPCPSPLEGRGDSVPTRPAPRASARSSGSLRFHPVLGFSQPTTTGGASSVAAGKKGGNASLVQESAAEDSASLDVLLGTAESGSKPEAAEDGEESKPEIPKKPAQTDATPWTILGAQFLPAQPPPAAPVALAEAPVEPAPIATLLAKSGDLTEAFDAPKASLEKDSSPAQPAAAQSRGPTDPSDDSKPSPEVAAAMKKLTPTPLEKKIPPPPLPKVEQIAAKVLENGEKVRGITAAKQPLMLLNAEKHSPASSPEQHRAVEISREESAVIEQAPRTVRPFVKAFEQPIEFPSDKIALDTFSPKLHVQTSPGATETQHVTDVRAAAVVDSIREHVQIVRISQQNELNVVLRPDAHTELSLQIRHVDGQIHLQARCERGDFTWLDSQWSAVQNALRDQGVRVEPLQAAFRAQDNTGSMFMHDQRGSQQQREQRPASFAFEQEISKPHKPSSRPTSSASRARGWQSWA